MSNVRIPVVAFMTTVGKNVGDEFIREGICSILADAVGDFEPLYVNKHDLTTLSRPLLDEMRLVPDKFEAADLIVQAGAPVFWHIGESRCYSEDWVRALWHERIFPLSKTKPFLNLGAGTCQSREGEIAPLLEDPACVEFVRQVGRCATVTVARDPLTRELLTRVGDCGEHELLPCPAFHAARRINGGKPLPARDVLAVNLMELAGHYMLKPENDPKRWSDVILETLPKLREHYRLVFVAHDEAEVRFLRHCNYPHEMIFHSNDYRDYLALYSRVGGIVANRVHAAVCVAGFGRPAVVIGNDSRIGIARPIGIPAIDASEVTSEWIIDALQSQAARRDDLFDERMMLREDSARRYAQLIRERLNVQTGSCGASQPSASLRSDVSLHYFGRELQYLQVPTHEEIFKHLVHRAPPAIVPALYQRRYYEDYFLLGRYFAPRSILEVGSRFGYSLIALCKGAAPTRVVSVDLESYENCFDLPTQRIARQNFEACVCTGSESSVSHDFIVGDSHAVEVDETFDLIHIDGDHTEAGARDDVVKFFRLLNPGGVMLVDDLDQPDVLRGFEAAIAELNLPPQCVAFYPHKHGLGMLHRTATARDTRST